VRFHFWCIVYIINNYKLDHKQASHAHAEWYGEQHPSKQKHYRIIWNRWGLILIPPPEKAIISLTMFANGCFRSSNCDYRNRTIHAIEKCRSVVSLRGANPNLARTRKWPEPERDANPNVVIKNRNGNVHDTSHTHARTHTHTHT
jgi:hypothetical protein